jgi:lysosomal acid lipase/cholesteryl ester hydrolase
VGFSQGSAQSFAALSVSPALNDKVSLFIALAPAVKTAAVGGFVEHLASSYPDILGTVFGRHSFLPIVLGWQRLLSPVLLERVVSTSMLLLFGWDCREISIERRLTLYQFVYSLSSVQCVSHWFHVLGQNDGKLCSFGAGGTGGDGDYDITRITCPVAVLSGERDYIIDASVVPTAVRRCVHAHVQGNYEHLPCLFAWT